MQLSSEVAPPPPVDDEVVERVFEGLGVAGIRADVAAMLSAAKGCEVVWQASSGAVAAVVVLVVGLAVAWAMSPGPKLTLGVEGADMVVGIWPSRESLALGAVVRPAPKRYSEAVFRFSRDDWLAAAADDDDDELLPPRPLACIEARPLLPVLLREAELRALRLLLLRKRFNFSPDLTWTGRSWGWNL